MDVPQMPLNALRAFEAAARLGSFTKAGLELRVSQTAVSHQVRTLETLLGVTLFDRLSRGVVLTDEGLTLLPVLTDAFRRMSAALSRFEAGNFREVLTIGCVSTFANGWLVPKLGQFSALNPGIDLRLKTNNNRADFLEDGLDCLIRFGDGAWHGADAFKVMDAPLTPVCAPELARRLKRPEDLVQMPLLRSYRVDEWAMWFRAHKIDPPAARGWMFDSSIALTGAAAQGVGVALVPKCMFARELEAGVIVAPFGSSILTGGYWLTWLKSRGETAPMQLFKEWIAGLCKAENDRAATAS